MSEPTSKPTNPKDVIGTTKVALSQFPPVAVAYGSLAMLNGMLKYGQANWRAAGIRASVYLDAAERHLKAWRDGEEFDPEDGVPNLGAVLACVAIVLDARAAGKLNDDRPPAIDLRKVYDELRPIVKNLLKIHEGKSPHHYTINDTELHKESA
jgi:hypothetical protein